MRRPVQRALFVAANLPVRFPRPKPRAANHRQALLASFGVLAVIAAAFAAVNSQYLFSPASLIKTPSEAQLYTGSIQLAPSRDNVCRRLAFDNRSGRMQELNTVPCGAATAAESEVPAQGSRIDRIRDGFRNH